jgi:hypothetical protein
MGYAKNAAMAMAGDDRPDPPHREAWFQVLLELPHAGTVLDGL